jgi:hypothetical protein
MDDFDDQIKQTTKNPWYAVRTFNCQVENSLIFAPFRPL